MKTKSVVFIILICVFGMMHAESVQADNPLKVLSQDSHQIRLQLQTPQLKLETVKSTRYQDVTLSGALPTADTGYPELPMYTTWVAIPPQGDFTVQVLTGNASEKENVLPKPVFTSEAEEKNNSYDRDAYSSSALYPATSFGYSQAQILRDFRVVQITLFPVQYNAAERKLQVWDDMTVEITMNNSPGENELPAYQGYSPVFTSIYESMICNFDAYREPILAPASPRALLIYGNSTDTVFLTKLNEYLAWKRQKGYEITAVSTSQTGGTSNSAIKAYIQTQYNNPNTKPDYIILLGDTSGSYAIPSFQESWSSYGGEGDYPYTQLAGNDYLGDAFIGRISAENISQLDVLFAKIYAYEKNINITGTAASWLNRMVLVGDPTSSGISVKYVNKFIKELAVAHNPEYTFTENYTGSPGTTINSSINQGVGFFNYRGYIGTSGWQPGSSLVNGTKLPHATILTCATGNFANGTATSEAMMRLGTAASPAGSVTAMGMATSGTHTLFNNCLDAGVYDGIFTYGMRTIGEALLNAKLYIKQVYGATHDTQANYFAHWCNLMGDPTVEIFTGIPGQLTMNAPATLPQGSSVLDVQVLDATSNPVAGATVTLYSTGQQMVVTKGFTDILGNVTFNVPGGMQGDLLLTASKHEFKPVQQTVINDVNGSLVYLDKTVIDNGTSGSTGNSDTYAEAGETIALSVSIKNTTANAITATTATLSSSDPFVSIVNGQSSFAAVSAGQTGVSLSNFNFTLNNSLPPQHDVRFTLLLQDTAQVQYTQVFHVTSYNANLRVENHNVLAGGNNVLDPAENGILNIAVKNNSIFGISDVYAEIQSLNDLVTVSDSVSYIGVIPANGISNSVDGFGIFARALLIPGMQMPIRVRLYNSTGFEQFSEFNIPIGEVSQNTPLGPDAYGYFIYDMTDVNYSDCPTYSWIEINPAEGGQGTLIPGLNDAGVDGDEGDQNGAVAVQVVDLPFTFPFYGVPYNQITVCVNGFIALGVTENPEFRNYHIPGGMGPSPMIAPFWDDLILISDAGIYKYYDAADHKFIIQYHKLRNGYNRTSLETFEVIFYDPIFHPTSMGDGMVKIQYKDFNNVDVGGSGYSPTHGNYCTVGIKDHTNSRGLEYTFNNQYALAAAPLSSQKALLITTAPILHESAFIVLDDIVITDPNGNSIPEPGETLGLGIKLVNLGMNIATNVQITASTTSEYATIVNGSSNYSNIPGDASGMNINPIQVQIDLDCPDGIVIPITCNITIAGNSWQYPITLTVQKPTIQVSGVFMNDTAGNGNGLIDPGETIDLIVNYHNGSALAADNITSNIMCLSEYININNPSLLLSSVPAGGTCQAVYTMTISPNVPVGNNITFYLTYLGDLVTPHNEQLVFSVGTTGMNEDFETDNGGFIPSPANYAWECGPSPVAGAHSGLNAWGTRLTSDYQANANYLLTTPNVYIGTNFMLEFWHYYSTEATYDGGNVSISTNGGSTWTLLTPEGGYPNNAVAALNGPGYDGNSNGWTFARFNLSAYANQNAAFRFTFKSDSMVQGPGWFIDDVRTTGFVEFAGKLTGTVTSSDPAIDFSHVVVQNTQNWATHPDASGNYLLYLPIGSHQVDAAGPGYHSTAGANVSISIASPAASHDFYLGYLKPAQAIQYNINNGILSLTWTAPENPEYTITGYEVYRKINAGAFELVTHPMDTSYTETLGDFGTSYRYYVVTTYAEGNSVATETVSFIYLTDNDDEHNSAPVTQLNNNFPNPFNPETSFSFSLKEQAPTKLYIYNIKGQLVRKLIDGVYPSGKHQVVWNGKDNAGRNVASGVYLYRLESKNFSQTKRAILMK